ncbi:MAG TPA: DUF167 domain-containing protein [Acidobacteriaceae bacterium]|nr:DUF167 domain-containing protein [Acidobacteriaceae bacterium]
MEQMLKVRDSNAGCLLPVRVHPGAKVDAITGEYDGMLKVSLSVPPVEGRANEALTACLAEALGVRRSQIVLISGASSRNKTVRIAGKSATDVLAALNHLLD